MNVKRIYIARLRSGHGGPIEVCASNAEEAKLNAFSTYTFCSAQWHPNPNVDDIIESVEESDRQTIGQHWMQSSVQLDSYKAPSFIDILSDQFSMEIKSNG